MDNQHIIVTERLILRKLKKEDAESVFSNWASDPEVCKYLTWNPHKSIEDTNRIMDIWLKEYENPNTFRFGIVLKENDELIGAIDVVGFIDGNPEIGYCLSRKYWNKGYMSEACKAFTNYLFSNGYESIIIEADENNIASNKVIEKTGFKFVKKETKQSSIYKPEIITVNWYILNKK